MGANKKGKSLPNTQAWDREIKRLSNVIAKAQKRGYKFSGDLLPEKPKRVSKKRLEQIKSIKPRDLFKQATFHDEISGETFTGLEGLRIEAYRKNKSTSTGTNGGAIDNKIKTPKPKKEKQEKPKKKGTSKQGKEKTDTSNKSKAKQGKKNTSSNNKHNTKKSAKKTPNKTQKSENNYPTISVIDTITDTLKEGFNIPIDYKIVGDVTDKLYSAQREANAETSAFDRNTRYFNPLLIMWENTIRTALLTEGGIEGLVNYVLSFKEEIFKCIEILSYESKDEKLKVAFNKLSIYLKGGEVPTKKEYDEVENYYDYYSDIDIIEYEDD